MPQEAIVGIPFVGAAAASVILLNYSTEGDEQIKNMLVGNILLALADTVSRLCVADHLDRQLDINRGATDSGLLLIG